MKIQARLGVPFGIVLGDILVAPFLVLMRKTYGDFGFSFDFIERDTKYGGMVREHPGHRDTRMYCERTFFGLILVFWFPFDIIVQIFLFFKRKKMESEIKEPIATEQDAWKLLKKMGISDPDKEN